MSRSRHHDGGYTWQVPFNNVTGRSSPTRATAATRTSYSVLGTWNWTVSASLVNARRPEKEMETVGAIVRGGGIVLAGTDSPLDSVATALHLNLRAQVTYGLEPWRALQTATLLPARAFGVEKDLGTIEPGKRADLTIVSGDPLTDIKAAAKGWPCLLGGGTDGAVYSLKGVVS